MNGLLLLLAFSSVLSFIIALFLSGSIVASLAQRQERQMAVLRAMGASRLRIALMHIGFAMTPAVVGLFAGAWLGEFGARMLENAIAWQLNLEIADTQLPQAARNGLLIAGGIGVMLAVLAPIVSGVRRPVREVLQDAIVARGRPWRCNEKATL